jgi:hypothetical protein
MSQIEYKVGDLVYCIEFGLGQITDISKDLALANEPYLVEWFDIERETYETSFSISCYRSALFAKIREEENA